MMVIMGLLLTVIMLSMLADMVMDIGMIDKLLSAIGVQPSASA